MEERRSPRVKQVKRNAVPCTRQNKPSSRSSFPLTTTICNCSFLPNILSDYAITIRSEITQNHKFTTMLNVNHKFTTMFEIYYDVDVDLMAT